MKKVIRLQAKKRKDQLVREHMARLVNGEISTPKEFEAWKKTFYRYVYSECYEQWRGGREA